MGERSPKQMPTAEVLRSYFNYDPDAGIVSWKHRSDKSRQWNTKYAGKEAGCICDRGYRQIRLNDRGMRYHRVAWVLMHGDCPLDRLIDHINGDTSDNRAVNLRLATLSQNTINAKRRAGCTLPRGVKRHRGGKTFEAQIRIGNKRRLRLGSFETAELAHAAYCSAAKRYHGEFARFD